MFTPARRLTPVTTLVSSFPRKSWVNVPVASEATGFQEYRWAGKKGETQGSVGPSSTPHAI